MKIAMETKCAPATDIAKGKSLPPVAELMLAANRLKTLYRQGWRRAGVSREQCESVAEHTFGVAICAWALGRQMRPELDERRVLLLGLLHDFGEIYAGDIVPGKMSLEDKHAEEAAAVRRVFAGCGAFGEECVAVWEEYEAQETPESRWVKQIDRLEMGIQGVVYEHSQAPIDLGDFMASTDDALHDADLKEFWSAVKALRPG